MVYWCVCEGVLGGGIDTPDMHFFFLAFAGMMYILLFTVALKIEIYIAITIVS